MNRNAWLEVRDPDAATESKRLKHLGQVSSMVDTKAPQEHSHLKTRSKQKTDLAAAQAKIDHDNRIMAERIKNMKPEVDNVNASMDRRASLAAGRAHFRKEQNNAIAAENARFVRQMVENPQRLSNNLGKQFADAEADQLSHLERISKFPVQAHHKKAMTNQEREKYLSEGGGGRLATHTNDPFAPELYASDGHGTFDTAIPPEGPYRSAPTKKAQKTRQAPAAKSAPKATSKPTPKSTSKSPQVKKPAAKQGSSANGQEKGSGATRGKGTAAKPKAQAASKTKSPPTKPAGDGGRLDKEIPAAEDFDLGDSDDDSNAK